jgi:predicted transcriptional regulator
MPHKDRDQRLAYLRSWKLRNRPAPAAEAQPDPSLPPRGVVVFSAGGTEVQCHACGRWMRSLNTHLRSHGLDARAYKELYDLPRTASLWPPSLKDKQRQAALDRGQGETGRNYLPPAVGRPIGQEPRLGVRIEASTARKGIYTRGGHKTRG